jgi:hypothetical protein
LCTSPKVDSGKPDVPTVRSGFREERLGSDISHRLKASGEDLKVNVGGSCGEGCSPPAKRMSVGGVIVLGGRESRLHGEGRQGIDVRRTHNRRALGEVHVLLVMSCFDERKADDRASGKSLIPGEPGAVKVACPVRRGGEETQFGCAPCPYLTNPHFWRLSLSNDTLHHIIWWNVEILTRFATVLRVKM